MLELRQIWLVEREHLVHHLLDFAHREHRRGQRVGQDGLVHQPRVAGQCAFDGHLLDAGAQVGEQGALRRQRADMHRLQPLLADPDGNLDARILRQVGHKPGIRHVAVELERVAALQRVDDVGRVLVAALQRDRLIGREPLLRLVFPGSCRVLRSA